MTKVSGRLDKRFRARLQKSPAKGGWTYVVMPHSATFFGTSRPGQDPRHHRRPSIQQLIHGSRRRYP
jgi:hypothetical protein